MRKIQIERKLFELFGHKFLAFENFQDADLNIDDQEIYKYDDQSSLVDTFAANQFYTIWSDERRLNAGVICALEGDVLKVRDLLKKIGIKDGSYATFDCGLPANPPRVLFLTTAEATQALVRHLNVATPSNRFVQSSFFGTKENKGSLQKKTKITET